jgi:hypothetical protein
MSQIVQCKTCGTLVADGTKREFRHLFTRVACERCVPRARPPIKPALGSSTDTTDSPGAQEAGPC